jgi:hypothetical protein
MPRQRPQAATSGRQVRSTDRQSIPSSSIDSCADDSRTVPSFVTGQMNRPRSRRLANRHSPCPSHHSAFTRSPRRKRCFGALQVRNFHGMS